MSCGHCSATKETHGIIRYRFLLQEQSHNEDPSLDILNAQRRKLLPLKTSIPLLIHQHCKEAELPVRLPGSTMYRSLHTRSLQLDWTCLGNSDLLAMCPKKASWFPARGPAQIARDKAQLLWVGEDGVTLHGVRAVPSKLKSQRWAGSSTANTKCLWVKDLLL